MKKVLLIDDESIFHFLAKKILEVSGVNGEMVFAFNGSDAFEKINQGFEPDFIFVDLDMPLMNGLQFVEALRKIDKFKSTKIAVLTSSITEDERKKALALGADFYMSKPLEQHHIHQLMA